MKALSVVNGPDGGVLELIDVPKPTPRPTELLVAVGASTISYGDTLLLRDPGRVVRTPASFYEDDRPPASLPGPTVGGGEFAGTVVGAGPDVVGYRAGD